MGDLEQKGKDLTSAIAAKELWELDTVFVAYIDEKVNRNKYRVRLPFEGGLVII
jgi:hypothetical protein